MPVCGFALQSAVVWAGALLDLPGTRSYAIWSELLPALLLVWQWRRGALRGRLDAWRRTAVLWAVVLIVLGTLLWPMAAASPRPTTLSIGSCDAADYAAGARLMLEFRRSDREGFLGLTEVVRLHSVDDFYEHFTRLNHFAPSALVAHHAAVLGRAPHELIGILTAVFLALSLPLVFWLARATLGFRSDLALVVAALYGLNPLMWYAVYHVAMGQLLAAQALALLTAVGVARARSGRRGLRDTFGLLLVGYGLVLAGYHFIIVVALAPAVLFALGLAWRRRDPAGFVRWSGAMLAPLVLAGGFYALRVAGLVERFVLFEESNFGWPIRAVGPEGWLGFVRGTTFVALPTAARLALVALVVGLAGLALRRRDWTWERRWTAVALTAPVLLGYSYLQWQGRAPGSHASYNAYKLLGVFFPGLLAVTCAWLGLVRCDARRWRWTGGAFLVAVFGAHVVGASAYVEQASRPQLIVDDELAALQQIEARPEVESINVLLPDMWSRLWANAFLLRKPQYFAEPTYEGRQPTELRGRWDLTSGLIQVRAAAGQVLEGSVPLGDRFALRRRGGADLRVTWGPQWFDPERNPRNGDRWRWSGPDPELVVENSTGAELQAQVRLEAWSVLPRELELSVEGRSYGAVPVEARPQPVTWSAVRLPPGRTVLRITSPTPPLSPSATESRPLLVAVRRIVVELAPADGTAAPGARRELPGRDS